MAANRSEDDSDAIIHETPKKKGKTTPREASTPNRRNGKARTPAPTPPDTVKSRRSSRRLQSRTGALSDDNQPIQTNTIDPTHRHEDPDAQPDKELHKQGEGEVDLVDVTSDHPAQKSWSIDNLPDILYVLQPTFEYAKSRHVIPMSPFLVFGKRVKNHLVLPRQISSKVEGWRMEAWIRTDRRITAKDILDRINPSFGITVNELEERRAVFRDKFHLTNWGAHGYGIVKSKVAAAGFDPASNSTRGLTPGLIDPDKGEAGGRIPVPPGFGSIHVSREGDMSRQVAPSDYSLLVDNHFVVSPPATPVHWTQSDSILDGPDPPPYLLPENPLVEPTFNSPEAENIAYELDLKDRSPSVEAHVDYSEYFPDHPSNIDELAHYNF